MLVSGMIIGSAFTLFVVPSIYVLLARTRIAPVSLGEMGLEDTGKDLPFRPLPVYQSSVQEGVAD
jgi:hypothetical protein